jgi:hypothetical protein
MNQRYKSQKIFVVGFHPLTTEKEIKDLSCEYREIE